MERVVLGVILQNGKLVVEQLADSVRADYRGLPAVMPGGRVKEGENPETVLKKKIFDDIGLIVSIEEPIASREHPLFPGGSIVYYLCSVGGNSQIRRKKTEKITNAQWVDLQSAMLLMLTLYSQVLAFMIRKIYGSSLPVGSKLPELEWLDQNITDFGNRVRKGELVAFPTETVYGIGANAFNSEAIANIFRVKNRPSDNPLIVHVASIEAMEQLTSKMSDLTVKLLERFTPGPLTILLPKNDSLPEIVTAGSKYVGIRIPAHNLALEFLAAAKVPIAAPSANKSGKPSATHHNHVIEAFGNELPNVLKAGNTTFGLESTVILQKNDDQFVIMRQGAVSKESLSSAFPKIEVTIAGQEESKSVPTPGSKYRHYAPKAKIELVPEHPREKLIAEFKKAYQNAKKENESVAILCSIELKKRLPKTYNVITLGSEKELGSIARYLYSALLESDAKRVTRIIIQSFPEKGIGRTIMERIRRAAEAE